MEAIAAVLAAVVAVGLVVVGVDRTELVAARRVPRIEVGAVSAVVVVVVAGATEAALMGAIDVVVDLAASTRNLVAPRGGLQVEVLGRVPHVAWQHGAQVGAGDRGGELLLGGRERRGRPHAHAADLVHIRSQGAEVGHQGSEPRVERCRKPMDVLGGEISGGHWEREARGRR